jgi:uncharacterized coiled-coil protein SlyX
MTTENKPESPKEEIFHKLNFEIEKIILGCRGVKSRQVHWSEAVPMVAAFCNKVIEDELQSIRDQLVEKERDRAIYANVVNYLNAQLAAKEETFNKMRSEFHAMNKRLMDDIVAKNTVIEAKEEEVTHWKGGYEAANETIKSLLDGFQVIENPDFPDDMMMVSTAIYEQLKSITPNP